MGKETRTEEPWEVVPYTVVRKDDENEEIINFSYGGHSFTMPIDCDGRISADDDAGTTFEVKYILDVDEEKELLFIEK